jgi:hypothetical protein
MKNFSSIALAVLATSFLSSCIDLSLYCCTNYDEEHPYTDLAVAAACEDDLGGVVDGSLAGRKRRAVSDDSDPNGLAPTRHIV